MPGSVSDPVVLDPFRTIVEVGWPTTPKYIAVTFHFKSTNAVASGAYGGIVDFYIGDQVPRATISTTAADFDENTVSTGHFFDGVVGYTTSGSHAIPLADVTFTGAPVGPFYDETWPQWTYGGESDCVMGYHFPAISGAAITDAAYSLPAFKGATSLSGSVLAHAFTGSPVVGADEYDPDTDTYNNYVTNYIAKITKSSSSDTTTAAAYDAATSIGSISISFAGMTAAYRGRTYSIIGIDAGLDDDYAPFGLGGTTPRQHNVTVLFRRDDL